MTTRILICDDEPHIRRAIAMKVERAGYAAQTASDGLEALDRLREEQPDLLITDCQMPRMTGLQLAEAVRAEFGTKLPILVLSAKGLELPAEELQQRWNILEVIGKPFSPRDLLERIQFHLKESPSCGTAPHSRVRPHVNAR